MNLLLPVDSQADEAHAEEVAHTKRFLEWWTASPAFREALPKDPVRVTREAGLEADPIALRQLWTVDPDSPLHREAPTPEVERYRAFMAEKLRYRSRLRELARSHNAPFDAWRLRQVNRCVGQLGAAKGDSLVHGCLAVELCEGCSVGCWFCGISALKLNGVYAYTEENAALWKGVLASFRDVIGEGAARGFCYWATDPLDNPDYERFCTDFHEILGRFPQTTTAQPLKDPARFRALHRLSRQRGCELDRFSILTLGTLQKVFAEYSPRELLHVELVNQMDGAWDSKAYAGRARDKQARFEKSTGRPLPPGEESSTIACVSGFLLRMPERSVELVSPCRSSERWPKGYRVHDRRTFRTAGEFDEHLKDMVSPERMPVRAPLGRPLRLRDDLSLSLDDDGFTAVTHFFRHTFKRPLYPAMRELGELLAEGRHDLQTAALILEQRTGTPLTATLIWVHQLYAAGFLDDEPPAQD